MAAFFTELFCEEIPARMQRRATEDLARLVTEALAGLAPRDLRLFHGPRRLAIGAELAPTIAATASTERGPRVGAPDAALDGFLRKHRAARDGLRQEAGFWVLDRTTPAQTAAAVIVAAMPGLLRRFPWPKSMRWGGTSAFTWIRPLRRIVCLLDGDIVPFDLAQGEDDGHGLRAGRETEGHRFLSPGSFPLADAGGYGDALRARHVIADAGERARLIADGVAARAADQGVSIVPDEALINEVAGLVEWPVALLGRIDGAFMDLPPEVMQVSMRVNQRYFATRHADGAPSPYFVFVANIDAPDGGAAIVAGNERVLRARFADARHFWDLDRRTTLADRVPALDGVTFHAALGSQGARVRRLVALAGEIADAVGAPRALAERAALLAKADLTAGMVGEFPALQGVMGGYYARHDGEDNAVADAVRDHYAPKGVDDMVPAGSVPVAVALADKLDQLAAFFAVGEQPTGSGDPYALRRAALGVIRIVREGSLRLDLRALCEKAARIVLDDGIGQGKTVDTVIRKVEPVLLAAAVFTFIIDRLRAALKSENARGDIINAVAGARSAGQREGDIVRLTILGSSIGSFLKTEDGAHLLAAYKRANNILKIEDRKDGPHGGGVSASDFMQPEETALHDAVLTMSAVADMLRAESYAEAMSHLASLRKPLDAFFQAVTVNAEDAALRRSRLRLLSSVRMAMNQVADFALIEG